MTNFFFSSDEFSSRHNSISDEDKKEMIKSIGVKSVDDLIDRTLPDSIKLNSDLNLKGSKTESEFLYDFRKLIQKNKNFKSYIGLGYYNCITPNVIKRNISLYFYINYFRIYIFFTYFRNIYNIIA